VAKPLWAAKAKATAKLSEVIKIKKHVQNGYEEQGHRWLEDIQKRQLEHIKNENEEQRHTQLEDM